MKKIKLFLIVVMLLGVTGCKSVNETASTVNETNDEKITLNKTLYFNDYKFQLGTSLDSFLKNTQVELNEEQFAAAKKSSRRISGLYYKVEGKLTEKNHSIDLTLYLDTSNLKNITLEGILLRSDRGLEELEPGFLSNPNLITCGFIFLDGYDIDHDSFVDFSNELKERAVKRKNKYTEKYDLVLEDDDFGIKITFDSLKENSPKIYITQVTVTNKVNLAW